MKLFSLLILSLLTNHAFAKPLTQRTYTFKTYAMAFKCHEGVANKYYPVPTFIDFSTSYGSSAIYYPSKIPLNNTSSVKIWDHTATKNCSDFSALLEANGELHGQAIQRFSEKVNRIPSGDCFKVIREDLEITVNGFILNGSEEMRIPLEDSECN